MERLTAVSEVNWHDLVVTIWGRPEHFWYRHPEMSTRLKLRKEIGLAVINRGVVSK